MKIRVKNLTGSEVLRIEGNGDIKEVLVNEDILNKESENISVCFKSYNLSGIIDFNKTEIEKLYNSIQKKDNLIGEIKKIVSAQSDIEDIENSLYKDKASITEKSKANQKKQAIMSKKKR